MQDRVDGAKTSRFPAAHSLSSLKRATPEAMSTLKTLCTEEMKTAFVRLADEHGMTEAALLRQMVKRVLESSGKRLGPGLSSGRGGHGGQLRLRLRTHEVKRVRELAEASGQSAQGWIVALIRQQIEHAVPFSKDELAELREAIRAVGPIGRNLNMITYRLLRSDQWSDAQGEFIQAAECAVDKVHRAVRNLAQKASHRTGAAGAG